MKKNLILPMLAGGLLLASCSQEAFVTPETEQYAQEFTKVFGDIDPNQNWSMAVRNSVNVTAEPGSTVSVFAYNGQTYKLAARYADFSGNGTISYDAVKGADDNIVVTDGINSVATTAGSTVNLMSTRAAADGISVTKLDDYKTIDVSAVKNFAQNLVPEQEDNTSKKGLTKNFAALPKVGEKVHVYPAYCAHLWTVEVGIYVNDENDDPVLLDPFFYDGDIQSDLQYQTSSSSDWGFSWGSSSSDSWTNASSSRNASNSYAAYNLNNAKSVRAKGWELDVSVGQMYGFYIKVYEGSNRTKYKGTYYSEARHNPEGVSMASYAKSGDQTFIGFEDDPNAEAIDLNDIVLMLDPVPYIVDHEPDGFIIAAEDLGSDDDFDFNDVVFSVTHVAGETTAIVKPLAAGGTLPIQLYYDGNPIGSELHSMFGCATNVMVNTEKNTRNADEIEIEVPGDFAIGEYADYENNEESHFRKFTISINNGERMLTSPRRGSAPQIMCLPGDWDWPKERVSIEAAYPDFGKWGQNYTNQDWIGNKVKSNVILR